VTNAVPRRPAARRSGWGWLPDGDSHHPELLRRLRDQMDVQPERWQREGGLNSTYPFYSNNCANFASQVLDTGGWYLTGGNSLQVSDSTKWTYNLAGIAGASRTWSQASSLYTFANNTGTYGWLDNIWNARTGDLLFVDWDPNGKADGSMGLLHG